MATVRIAVCNTLISMLDASKQYLSVASDRYVTQYQRYQHIVRTDTSRFLLVKPNPRLLLFQNGWHLSLETFTQQ